MANELSRVIDLAIEIQFACLEIDKVSLVNICVLKELLAHLSDNFLDFKAQRILEFLLRPQVHRVHANEVIENVTFDLYYVVFRQDAFNLLQRLLPGLLILNRTQDPEVKLMGNHLALSFNIVIMVLELLKQLQELVFLLRHSRWQ